MQKMPFLKSETELVTQKIFEEVNGSVHNGRIEWVMNLINDFMLISL